MSIVFPWQKSIPSVLSNLGLKQGSRELFYFLSRKKTQKATLWMLGSLGVTLMSAWHGKLVLATGMGVGTMVLVYYGQRWRTSFNWNYLRQYLKGSQGSLILAVASGGMVALGTYLTASMWVESENRWLTLGMLMQSVGTSATLGLVLWNLTKQQHHSQETPFKQLLKDLTADEALKRLIAVRSLLHLLESSHLSLSEQTQLQEYFTLMLTTESEIKVRQALLDSLRQIEGSQILLQPIKQKKSAKISLLEPD